MYPWPTTDPVLEQALTIALDYLEFTGQAVRYRETRGLCADVIVLAWRGGIRHRIKLADLAIAAIEKHCPVASRFPSQDQEASIANLLVTRDQFNIAPHGITHKPTDAGFTLYPGRPFAGNCPDDVKALMLMLWNEYVAENEALFR
jgi:hypothetical protein